MLKMISTVMLTLVTLTFALPAVAQEGRPTVVVELYTSQGCSSCPPADELLGELTKRSDIIPLALHVDYWDYLGWKDTMGSPDHTKRQRAYARMANSRSIYTPQMIIGGKTHVIGHKPGQLRDAIAQAAATDPGLNVSLRRSGDSIIFRVDAEPGLPNRMVVQLFRYNPRYEVSIRRGENSGRSIVYHNAVNFMEQIGTWNGRNDLSVRARVTGDDPIVVVLQERGPGRILAAARIN